MVWHHRRCHFTKQEAHRQHVERYSRCNTENVMLDNFQILNSDKIGLEAEESHVVIRGGISFLRILGSEPNWALMTATASEDHGRIQVCADRARLVEAAFRLSVESGCLPRVERDHAGREYVKIGTLTRVAGDSDEDLTDELRSLCRRFFEIFDAQSGCRSALRKEMSEIYEAIKPDESGADAYLGDGVWLSPDGSLHDHGW